MATPEELAAQFGYGAAFFYAVPELSALLQQALRENWSPARFQSAFMQTGWYRQRSASQRQWETLQSTDPASADRRIVEQMTKLRNLAGQMGAQLDEGRLRQIALDSLSGGYSDDLLRTVLSAELHYQPGQTSGGAAATETDLKKLAADYGVSLSDQDIGSMIQGVAAGRMTQDSLLDFVRDQARSKYPGMKDWIDQGLSVRQVASPYLTSYSQLLEVDPDSVNLQDPQIQKALQGSKNASGQWQQQSLYDFENTLRQTPQWEKTKNAREVTQTATNAVLRDWGLIS